MRALWDVLGAFWRLVGGLLDVFWRSFGGLKCKIKLEIVLRGFHFPKGPSWCCVGDVFWVLGGHFGINFQAFSRRPSSQQSENVKSRF